MVERLPVKESVVGSSPTSGADSICWDLWDNRKVFAASVRLNGLQKLIKQKERYNIYYNIKMKNKDLIFHSLGHAILVFLYISGVAWLLFNAQKLFSPGRNFLAPVFMLLLFVLSATIVGTLVLGRPAVLYFDGSKSLAFRFFGYTLAWIFIITLIVFLFLQ